MQHTSWKIKLTLTVIHVAYRLSMHSLFQDYSIDIEWNITFTTFKAKWPFTIGYFFRFLFCFVFLNLVLNLSQHCFLLFILKPQENEAIYVHASGVCYRTDVTIFSAVCFSRVLDSERQQEMAKIVDDVFTTWNANI